MTSESESESKSKNEQSTLPSDFEWAQLEPTNEKDINDITTLMNTSFDTHVEGELIKWLVDTCIGIRVKKNGLLVGVIGGHLNTLQVNKNKLNTITIDLLCVHSKLRGKKMATTLTKELARIYSNKGITMAFFTTTKNCSKDLTKSVAKCHYFRRAINVKLLLDASMVVPTDNVSSDDIIKTLALPNKPANKNFMRLEERHIDQTHEVLSEYLGKYSIRPVLTKDEFRRTFFNNKIVTTWVLEDGQGKVVDMISYYTVKTKNTKGGLINDAHLYYYTSTTETSYRLIKDAMIVAKLDGIDMFSALDIMESNNVLRELNFEQSTTPVFYHLHNVPCKDFANSQLGLVPISF